jgi:hypothetical protein
MVNRPMIVGAGARARSRLERGQLRGVVRDATLRTDITPSA